MPVRERCIVCVEELAVYMRYVRKLDFFEPPDYDYLRKLFYDVLARHGWHCDWRFDWIDRQQAVSVLYYCLFLLSLKRT